MRCSVLLVALLSATGALTLSRAQNSNAVTEDRGQILQLRQDFFDGISRKDDELLRRPCSPDFQLFENGEIMHMDVFIRTLHSAAAGFNVSYEF